ncbi:MAG: response regulator [Christensenellales bacterium]|jgi:response regulator of citrate/malate metabolism
MYRMMVLKSGFKRLHVTTMNTLRDCRFCVNVMELDSSVSVDCFLGGSVDLLVIDLSIKPEHGIKLIRELRISGEPVEVVAYVARDDCKTLRSILRLGVVDCLVDPFDTGRFEQAIRRFLFRVGFNKQTTLSQKQIDEAIKGYRPGETELPKGLQKKTLNMIREVFNSSPDTLFSCGDIVETVNLSHITVKRYLSYLNESNELIKNINYNTGGRPCSLYRYNTRIFA